MSHKIAILGLGYVGLPLALALAKKYKITGFDVSKDRIDELDSCIDRNGETPLADLRSTTMSFTSNPDDLSNHDIFIVTVPTPIDHEKKPDLKCLESASQLCGKYIKKGAIVVFESTVYPGVTEEYCGPIIESVSGLQQGKDFFLGYSPERINPGDTKHTIENVTKIVAGETPETLEVLSGIYGVVNGGNVYKAENIKTAEAAKVIENAQRDINIAFVNEVSIVLSKMGLSAYNVLEAAATKWNFLNFKPGLVGGHCIGVDPYYLTHAAERVNHQSRVILSGRSTNEAMPLFLAEQIHTKLRKPNAKILCLGVTFKENVSDIRNSKVLDLIDALKNLKHDVEVHDPYADIQETKSYLGIELIPSLHHIENYDAVIAAVPHDNYTDLGAEMIEGFIAKGGLIADIKNIWKDLKFSSDYQYWLL